MAGFGFGNSWNDEPAQPPASDSVSEEKEDTSSLETVDAGESAADDIVDAQTEDAPAPEPETESKSKVEDKPRKRGRPKKGSGEVDKALVRRIAQKVEALRNADESELALLGAVLGAQTGAVDVTVAVMTSDKGDLSALDDTIRIADADVALRAVEAMSLGHAGLSGVWKVLTHLDLVQGRFPSDDLAATKKIIVALGDLTDEHRTRIAAVADLARKN